MLNVPKLIDSLKEASDEARITGQKVTRSSPLHTSLIAKAAVFNDLAHMLEEASRVDTGPTTTLTEPSHEPKEPSPEPSPKPDPFAGLGKRD